MNKVEYLTNLSVFCEETAASIDMMWNGLLDNYAPCHAAQRKYVECVAMCRMVSSYLNLMASYFQSMRRKEVQKYHLNSFYLRNFSEKKK